MFHSVILQHLSYGNGSLHVDAAFQQTLWSVAPICSGSEVAQGTPVCFWSLSFLLYIILSFLLFLICCLLLVLCFLLSLLPALSRFFCVCIFCVYFRFFFYCILFLCIFTCEETWRGILRYIFTYGSAIKYNV